jgi:hypothetical protein
MIEFTPVSREFASLVDRRRELLLLLGSVYAALGIFLQNALQGNFPPALGPLESHLFAFHSLVLMAASLILSLRMARLHGGMVLQGVLIAGSMRDQTFTRKGDIDRASRHNYLGASFLQFLLVDAIAAISSAVLVLAVGGTEALALGAGVTLFLIWLAFYFRFHHRAAAFARGKLQAEPTETVTHAMWESHASASLEQTNKDMLGLTGFVGLMLFSSLEVLSGLGRIHREGGTDIPDDLVRTTGPILYTALMVLTCVFALAIHLRLRVAVGRFSLELDPTDRPFQPFRLTDSFLGYLLLCFLLGVSFHLFLVTIVPAWGRDAAVPLAIDVAVVLLAVLAEPATLALARRGVRAPAPLAPK